MVTSGALFRGEGLYPAMALKTQQRPNDEDSKATLPATSPNYIRLKVRVPTHRVCLTETPEAHR